MDSSPAEWMTLAKLVGAVAVVAAPMVAVVVAVLAFLGNTSQRR